jgi:uncharacterized protein YqcC (DUF446 family)
MSVHIKIASLLVDIEAELRRLDQWDAEPPAPEALASPEPFCVDTLTFVQWVQFIFIPRMHALAQAGRLPPGRCEIEPLMEEYFRNSRLDIAALQRHIQRLDRLVNDALANQ